MFAHRVAGKATLNASGAEVLAGRTDVLQAAEVERLAKLAFVANGQGFASLPLPTHLD